jgi:hypothetical protein
VAVSGCNRCEAVPEVWIDAGNGREHQRRDGSRQYFVVFGRALAMPQISTEALRRIVETDVFTIPEAAEYLGMTRQGVFKQVRSGRIPIIREKLILRADLDQYDATVSKGSPRKGGKEPAGKK